MTDEDMKVVEAMSRCGGSFVRALAEACRRADAVNLDIIKKSWPAYWAYYAEYTTKYENNRNWDSNCNSSSVG
jgi:hypothetical protein